MKKESSSTSPLVENPPILSARLQKINSELSAIKFALDVSSIVAITDQKGKITYVNDKFCEISKYSKKELIGQDHRIVNSGYHSKEFMRNLWQTIRSGNVWKGEIRNKAKDGTFYWVSTTIVPFLDKNNKPYQYVAIRNEITQRKRLEDELQSLSQQIIQAQETERERIALEIHDDLGQSLATLKMLVQSLEFPRNERVEKFSSDKKKIINYLNTIIEKSRHLSHTLRPPTLEILGLSTALKAMIHELKCKKDLTFKLTMPELDPSVFSGDIINLYRIVQEAVSNVVTHSRATRCYIKMEIKGGVLFVTIRDNGKGFEINRDEFPLNYSSESKTIYRRGLGIGLSTMEERTHLLGGKFFIQSQRNHGTVIQLQIPVHRAPETAPVKNHPQ